MPTELLDLRLAFRALSDEDSDEGAGDAAESEDLTEGDDDLEDDDMDSDDGDGDSADGDEAAEE